MSDSIIIEQTVNKTVEVTSSTSLQTLEVVAQGPEGPQGEVGQGFSAGGTTGQVLVKSSSTDYDTEWSDSAPLAVNVTGIVDVANGGTGADNADSARSNLSAAKSGTNSDITSLSGITGGISTADFVQFDTAYATTLGVGQIGWDGNNTLGLGMAGGNVVQKIGEDFFYYIKASSAIAKGQLCMFTGSVGASGVVTAAPATGVTNGQYIMGVAAEAISNNAFGLVQVFGTLRNVDTSAFSDGDVLYYNSAVTGGFTTTFPASGPIVTCAAVVKGGSSGGGVLQIRVGVTQRVTAGSGITVTQDGAGTTISNASPSTGGTVTSVDTAGTVNGLTLTGGPITSSGTITLGGTLDLSSPPAIGGATPAAGTFTTLTATGQTSLGGSAGSEALRAVTRSGSTNYVQVQGGVQGVTRPNLGAVSTTGTGAGFNIFNANSGPINFGTTFSSDTVTEQFRIAHTASAVNYVQVTGAATGGGTQISSQGSDTNIGLQLRSKGTGDINLMTAGGTNQVVIRNTASAVNFISLSGSATGFAERIYTEGSDTNIALAFQSKGTGAIDLAAGSSGVNISNGGTVTAITRTSGGGSYTSPPTVAITAPTTAGGVQATATCTLGLASVAIAGGGTGYTAGDVLTFVGGTGTAGQVTVSTVSAGVITAVTATNAGNYSVVPTNPISVTGGTGSGATFTVSSWAVLGSFTITNAGSGYVEQPTVSFSGGGGSGAAAYATVGSGTTVKSIGSTMSFYTPAGEGLRVLNSSGTAANYMSVSGAPAGSGVYFVAGGSDTNISTTLASKGSSSVAFATNGGAQLQFNVAHTASAVNYVQVTGAATTVAPQITAQGSDTNIAMVLSSKGTSDLQFRTNNSGQVQFQVLHTASAVNRPTATGAIAGAAPVIGVAGTDTNIDLALTPKGTGLVRFGTYTAGAPTATGYISIKAADGTTYKVLVGT